MSGEVTLPWAEDARSAVNRDKHNGTVSRRGRKELVLARDLFDGWHHLGRWRV